MTLTPKELARERKEARRRQRIREKREKAAERKARARAVRSSRDTRGRPPANSGEIAKKLKASRWDEYVPPAEWARPW